MRRQLLAGFAGFLIACTVWMLVRSGTVRVPDVRVTFSDEKANPAEPQEASDPPLQRGSQIHAFPGVMQFASLHALGHNLVGCQHALLGDVQPGI